MQRRPNDSVRLIQAMHKRECDARLREPEMTKAVLRSLDLESDSLDSDSRSEGDSRQGTARGGQRGALVLVDSVRESAHLRMSNFDSFSEACQVSRCDSDGGSSATRSACRGSGGFGGSGVTSLSRPVRTLSGAVTVPAVRAQAAANALPITSLTATTPPAKSDFRLGTGGVTLGGGGRQSRPFAASS